MRVLFIQLKRLGDVLMVTPSIRALKTAYPSATLHFLVDSWGLEAIQHHPLIDQIIVTDQSNSLRRFWRLRREQYDVAIDFQGSPRSAHWTWLSGAKLRIGFPKRGRTPFYNCRVPLPSSDSYSAEEKLVLLTPLQVRSSQAALELHASPKDQEQARRILESFGRNGDQRLVALSPCSRKGYKRWPAEHYSIVCDHLHRTWGFHFLPLFSSGEEHMVEAVIAGSRHPQTFLYPYRPISFGGAKALIEHCCFYLGNDNGIRHAAIACGKPTAAIFGTIDPMNWTPPGNTFHRYLWGRDSIASVTPQQVIGMVSELISTITP